MPRNQSVSKYVGTKVGRLSIVSEFKCQKRGIKMFVCKCECGADRIIPYTSIYRAKSCGCLKLEIFKKYTTTHGLSKHPLNATWRAIKDRCFNVKNLRYSFYGGRGITMFPEWAENFHSFYKYVIDTIGDKPKGRTMDRINTNGDYAPGNIRWLTAAEQNRNTRRNISITAFGKTQVAMDWIIELGLPKDMVYWRLRNGWDPVLALTIPSTRHYQLPHRPSHP